MKFGVTLPNFGKYAEKADILNIASTAEELGFDSLWVSDHVVIPDGHKVFGDVFYDPLVTLSYIAARTKTIKLGTSVIILPYRNPVVVAKMISTLDQLSEGRVLLGIGAGWMKKEFEALGVDFGQRGAVTNEYLEALKILWTKDKPTYKGQYVEFSDISFLPKPYQKPYPEIWFGGGSAKAIDRAVKYGQGWQPVGLSPQELAIELENLHELLKINSKSNFCVSLRRNVEINDQKDIPEEDTLRGTIEKIVNGIRKYKEVGVNHLILHFLSGTSEGILNSMSTFSKEIKPRIKPTS